MPDPDALPAPSSLPDPSSPPDRRLHAFRPDLADARLRDRVTADRYAEARPGRVAAGLVPVRPSPGPGAVLDTYYTAGEPLRIFETADGWAWCQSCDDGYVGYVPVEAVTLDAPPAELAHIRNPLAYLFVEPDLKTQILDTLPRHARVVLADEPPVETRNTFYRRLATGGYVAQAALSDAPPRSPDLVTAARYYLGAPYLWAGKSFAGIDCSGLVQRAFQDLGNGVPRDTDMQLAHFDTPVALASLDDLCPGDLIFSRGHVGIATGTGVIHAEGTRHMRVLEQPAADFLAEVCRGETGAASVRRP